MPRGRPKKTVQSEETVKKETVLNQGDCPAKETGHVRTVAEARGMTPEELIERKGMKAPYRNNYMQRAPQFEQLPSDGGQEETGAANPVDNGNNMATYVNLSLELANLPEIDMMDPVAVQNRINEYFQIVSRYGTRPTVVGLGMALNGMDRRRLYEIRSGYTSPGHNLCETLPKSVRVVIKNAYKIMENLWENWMYGIRGNPAAAIFLGKNHFGYEDKTEYVVTPNQRNDSDYDPASIRERLGLPPTDSDSDTDSDSE